MNSLAHNFRDIMDFDRPEMSYVIPCLNESKTILRCVKECLEVLANYGINGEVVVADNGSSDDSSYLASKAGAKVISVLRKGYGNVSIGGIRAAKGKYVIMADADLSYDFQETPKFLGKLRDGYDLVIGCRFPAGGGTILPKAMPWSHRFIGTPVISWIGRLFFGTKIHDFNSGMRGFVRERILSLNLSSSGMEFASEMIVRARYAGYKICETPIIFRRDKRGRRSHIRPIRDGLRHLFVLFKCLVRRFSND